MIRICPKCGALLLDDTEDCSFCNAPPDEIGTPRVPNAARAAAASAADAEEPEWRAEVSRRLQQYRARRGRLCADDSQSGLPFHPAPNHVDAPFDGTIREHPHSRPAARPRRNERVDILIQSELDFSSAADERARPQTALVPVASLAERRWAGLIDLMFLSLTCAGFLGLFKSLGGQITLDKTTAAIYFAIAYLFYSVYFSLFITLAGATPGLKLRGLSIVRLDGRLPDTRQLLWRSFGYLLSAATLALGFIWAFWDEDHFTWQDRISQTYITAAEPLLDPNPVVVSARHTFAHK